MASAAEYTRIDVEPADVEKNNEEKTKQTDLPSKDVTPGSFDRLLHVQEAVSKAWRAKCAAGHRISQIHASSSCLSLQELSTYGRSSRAANYVTAATVPPSDTALAVRESIKIHNGCKRSLVFTTADGGRIVYVQQPAVVGGSFIFFFTLLVLALAGYGFYSIVHDVIHAAAGEPARLPPPHQAG